MPNLNRLVWASALSLLVAGAVAGCGGGMGGGMNGLMGGTPGTGQFGTVTMHLDLGHTTNRSLDKISIPDTASFNVTFFNSAGTVTVPTQNFTLAEIESDSNTITIPNVPVGPGIVEVDSLTNFGTIGTNVREDITVVAGTTNPISAVLSTNATVADLNGARTFNLVDLDQNDVTFTRVSGTMTFDGAGNVSAFVANAESNGVFNGSSQGFTSGTYTLSGNSFGATLNFGTGSAVVSLNGNINGDKDVIVFNEIKTNNGATQSQGFGTLVDSLGTTFALSDLAPTLGFAAFDGDGEGASAAVNGLLNTDSNGTVTSGSESVLVNTVNTSGGTIGTGTYAVTPSFTETHQETTAGGSGTVNLPGTMGGQTAVGAEASGKDYFNGPVEDLGLSTPSRGFAFAVNLTTSGHSDSDVQGTWGFEVLDHNGNIVNGTTTFDGTGNVTALSANEISFGSLTPQVLDTTQANTYSVQANGTFAMTLNIVGQGAQVFTGFINTRSNVIIGNTQNGNNVPSIFSAAQ